MILILFVPLLLAIAAIAAMDGKHAKYIALAGCLASLAIAPFLGGSAQFSWLSVGKVPLDIAFAALPINKLLIFLALAVSPAVLAYSFDFMDIRSEQKRYYVEMLALVIGALLLSISDSFMSMLIAWEILSLASYFLVGFWGRERAASATRKMATIALVSDIALIASMVMFASNFGTLNFPGIVSGAASGSAISEGFAIFLLVVAVVAKASQFPFHEWLAYSTEGPAPAAALLGAVVPKAGIYAAIVLYPILAASSLMPFLLAFGILTTIFSAFNALRETSVKKVVAYAAVQQTALALVALGMGSVLAAVYLLIVQSFCCVLLLLLSGTIAKVTDNKELVEISGLRHNKVLFAAALCGALFIAGFIPFAGFFGMFGVEYASIGNLFVYVLVAAAGMGTSFYIFRWLMLCSRKGESGREAVLYEAQGRWTAYSLLFLAFMSLAAGLLFFGIGSYLKMGFAAGKGIDMTSGIAVAAIETFAAAAGAYASYLRYRSYGKTKRSSIFAQFAHSGAVFNEIYTYLAAFFYEFADGVLLLDAYIDGAYDAIGGAAVSLVGRTKFAAGKRPWLYMAVFAVAFLVMLLVLVG